MKAFRIHASLPLKVSSHCKKHIKVCNEKHLQKNSLNRTFIITAEKEIKSFIKKIKVADFVISNPEIILYFYIYSIIRVTCWNFCSAYQFAIYSRVYNAFFWHLPVLFLFTYLRILKPPQRGSFFFKIFWNGLRSTQKNYHCSFIFCVCFSFTEKLVVFRNFRLDLAKKSLVNPFLDHTMWNWQTWEVSDLLNKTPGTIKLTWNCMILVCRILFIFLVFNCLN